jgi:hypothetical protein
MMMATSQVRGTVLVNQRYLCVCTTGQASSFVNASAIAFSNSVLQCTRLRAATPPCYNSPCSPAKGAMKHTCKESSPTMHLCRHRGPNMTSIVSLKPA